jgi:hypothetical protein
MPWIPPVSVPATVVEATMHEQTLENISTRNDLIQYGNAVLGVVNRSQK